MRNRIIYHGIFILFSVNASINAQRLYELTPYSFYQEWSLIEKESHGNLRVYEPIDKSGSAKSNSLNAVLKFNRRNHICYKKKFKAINKSKPQVRKDRPLNWSNAPKTHTSVTGVRCPSRYIKKSNSYVAYKLIPRYSKKGVWSVYMENDIRFLVLEHKVSKNGNAYSINKKEEFQIVSLKEDRMVLRKVIDHAE